MGDEDRPRRRRRRPKRKGPRPAEAGQAAVAALPSRADDGAGSRSRRQPDDQGRGRPAEPSPVALPDLGDWAPPPPPEHGSEEIAFQELDLHPRLLRALLEDLRFTLCTPIQAMSLPFTLDDADLAGQAQTGTGKTAAFLLTILQRFLGDTTPRQANQPYALVLAPTRELAEQIITDARAIGAYCGLRTLAVYGGVTYDHQRQEIATGLDLVAATPGRLIDYLRQDAIDLSRVRILVIDEADRMLDMGFIPDVKRILARLPRPERRQTMLFSATLSPDILRLAENWMRPNPVTVEVEPDCVVAEGIEETVYAISSQEKLALLLNILQQENVARALIFRNRRRDVDDLYDDLQRYGIPCGILSGDVPQKRRMQVLEAFRKGELQVVVATDVAGRGIHIEGISHVINYDFPFEAEDYVHRIGRTGRAGHSGKAISFAGEDCAFVIPDIETFIQRPLPVVQPDEAMLRLPEPVPGARPAPAPGGKQLSDRRPSNRGGRRPEGGGRPRRPSGRGSGGGGRPRPRQG